MSDELLYPYVTQCFLKAQIPSYEGYCEWAVKIEKDNLLYRLASHFCFSTLHSLHLFRCGIRNCNDDVSIHARHKLTALLYACNNIKYQEILCHDTCFLLSLDPENRKVIMQESSRREGGEVGEGYDFLLENRNKLYKSFLPSDSAPTFDQWVQVTKTARDLEEISESASERLDINTRASSQRARKFNEEIHGARKLIRTHGFLMKPKHGLTTLDDSATTLDVSLLNYVSQSEKNRSDYYDSYLKHETMHLPLLNTGVELKPTSCSEDEIRQAVLRKLNMLQEPFYSFYKKGYKKSMSQQELTDFNKALEAQLKNQDDAMYEGNLLEAFSEYMDLHAT